MTVRANKPAFSIREKLKELDYAHVPYDKMPAGSVIQYATVDSSTNVSTSSNSYASLTNVVLNFSPKLSNSKLLITYSGAIRSMATGNTRARIAFRLIRSGTALTGYNFNEIVQWKEANFNTVNVEAVVPIFMELNDTPNTTETLTYTWQWQSIGSTFFDTAFVTYRQTIYEIKQ
jgi:hypothetical protein